jgi:hypothetical protein
VGTDVAKTLMCNRVQSIVRTTPKGLNWQLLSGDLLLKLIFDILDEFRYVNISSVFLVDSQVEENLKNFVKEVEERVSEAE